MLFPRPGLRPAGASIGGGRPHATNRPEGQGMSESLLQGRGLSKSFFGTTVLDAVDIDIRAGEIHALLG